MNTLNIMANRPKFFPTAASKPVRTSKAPSKTGILSQIALRRLVAEMID
jgi:hypothetical protein